MRCRQCAHFEHAPEPFELLDTIPNEAQPAAMLAIALALLASSQSCTEVQQQCRACKVVAGRQTCSTVGIACQPVKRICRPAGEQARQAPASKAQAEKR
jgi:hypothetical protein